MDLDPEILKLLCSYLIYTQKSYFFIKYVQLFLLFFFILKSFYDFNFQR